MNTGTSKLTQAQLADIKLMHQLRSSIQYETQKKLFLIYHEAKAKIEASTDTSKLDGMIYNTCFLGEKFCDFPVISKLSKEYCILRGFAASGGEWGYTVVKGYKATGIHNRIPKL